MGQGGSDIYVVDSPGDVIIETAGGGFDIVRSSISYALGDFLNALVLTGSDNIDGTGNSLDNVLKGNLGNNHLDGHEGNDRLFVGAGSDTLTGGLGRDQFIFSKATDNIADTLTDFTPGQDSLRFDHETFAGIGDVFGRLNPTVFLAGPGMTEAASATERIIYDTRTGFLYYDADGEGGNPAEHIATLQGQPIVRVSDCWVV